MFVRLEQGLVAQRINTEPDTDKYNDIAEMGMICQVRIMVLHNNSDGNYIQIFKKENLAI